MQVTTPIVDRRSFRDISPANSRYLDATPRGRGIDTIQLIMKDGKIYKSTL